MLAALPKGWINQVWVAQQDPDWWERQRWAHLPSAFKAREMLLADYRALQKKEIVVVRTDGEELRLWTRERMIRTRENFTWSGDIPTLAYPEGCLSAKLALQSRTLYKFFGCGRPELRTKPKEGK